MTDFLRRYFLFTVCLSFSVIVPLGCTKNESSDEFENYVHEPVKANIKGLDPATTGGDLYSAVAMGQIYEGLMQYSYLERPIKPEPSLADGMPVISKDLKTYEFKIKKGVLFHDDPCFRTSNGRGRELTADDFIFSWKRLADPANHSDGFWIFDGKVNGITEWRDAAVKRGAADYAKPIDGFEAVDKYTLKIHLKRPYPQLLYVLTMTPSYVLPHEAVETYGQELQNHPVGTGPYKFRSWTRNARLIYDKNPNYRNELYPSNGETQDKTEGRLDDAGKKLPLNDGVVFTEIIEDQPRFLNFRKGEFDWVEIPKDNFDSSVVNDELTAGFKDQGVVLNKSIDQDVTFDGFNMEDPVVGGAKGKYIRQAMTAAIDTENLIKKFYNGRAVSAQGPVPPSVVGYDPGRKNSLKTYDIGLAKTLLKKAGYPDGIGLPEIVYETPDGTTMRQMSEFFQQEMGRIGIKVRISMNTWPQFVDKIKNRKAQMFGLAWAADYPDAENFFQLFYGPNSSPGPNQSNYNNPEFNKLYDKVAVMADTPERNAIYHKMEDILVEDCPYIYDVHRKSFVLTNGWFKNYKRNLSLLNYVKYYRIDTQAKRKLRKKL